MIIIGQNMEIDHFSDQNWAYELFHSEYRCSSRIFYFSFFQPVQMNIFGTVVIIVHREWVQRDVNSCSGRKTSALAAFSEENNDLLLSVLSYS